MALTQADHVRYVLTGSIKTPKKKKARKTKTAKKAPAKKAQPVEE